MIFCPSETQVKEKNRKRKKRCASGSTISLMEFYEAHNRNEDGAIVPLPEEQEETLSHFFFISTCV